MKGGNIYRLRGRHLWLTLITLIFTTIFLWAWEKNPLITTLLSAQDQFVMPYSEIFVDAPHHLSVSSNPKDHKEEEDAHSFETEEDAHLSETEETRNEQTVQGFDTKSIETEETRNEQLVQGLDAHSIETEETRNGQAVEGSDAHLIETEETRNEQTVQGFDAVPMDSTITLSTDRKENDRDVSSFSEKKVCNYAKGRWVEDSRRPLYSGFECKQWLSEMWACRLTQRTYFSYERYRWQPENCEMPDFERSAFLRRMQDKTIAFVGDSLGRQQFQSLMCMVTGGKESPEVQDVGREYGLVKARGAIRPDGWAYRFPNTNTTILYYWSASLCDLQPLSVTDRATDVAMHLDRPPAFLSQFLHRFDVVVLNTGHHWNRGKLRGNRWVMHVNGRPNEDKKLAEIGNAKNFTIFSVVRWLDSQFPSYPWLKVFFRTISPRHFVNGDWNTGGSCDNTIPLSSGSEVWQNESSDPVIEGALKGTRVKILDITAISQLRDEGHISRYSKKSSEGAQDCLHWCLPGIPDTWNELLVAQL